MYEGQRHRDLHFWVGTLLLLTTLIRMETSRSWNGRSKITQEAECRSSYLWSVGSSMMSKGRDILPWMRLITGRPEDSTRLDIVSHSVCLFRDSVTKDVYSTRPINLCHACQLYDGDQLINPAITWNKTIHTGVFSDQLTAQVYSFIDQTRKISQTLILQSVIWHRSHVCQKVNCRLLDC